MSAHLTIAVSKGRILAGFLPLLANCLRNYPAYQMKMQKLTANSWLPIQVV